jgi:hypothetical protein
LWRSSIDAGPAMQLLMDLDTSSVAAAVCAVLPLLANQVD